MGGSSVSNLALLLALVAPSLLFSHSPAVAENTAANQCSCSLEVLLDKDCCQCTVNQVANATASYFKERLLKLVETPLFRVYAPYPDQPGKELYDVQCSIPEFEQHAKELSGMQLGCAIQQCGCSSAECNNDSWRHKPCFMQCREDAEKVKQSVGSLALTKPVKSDGGHGPVQYDLLQNPEQFTGYGTLLEDQSASKIWESLYTDKVCLTSCEEETESEPSAAKRLVYRVVSGLHASVSTHISMHYGLYDGDGEPATKDNWGFARSLHFGPWRELFDKRVGQHPKRIQNMHFVFALLARALHKLKPRLSLLLQSGSKACPSCAAHHDVTEHLLQQLVSPAEHVPGECKSVLEAFNTDALFRGNSSEVFLLREDIKRRFSRMGHLMTCVGCDRCKLWGSLQFHAARVALGILLDEAGGENMQDARDQFSIPRLAELRPNDVVALVNALAQLSKSIHQVKEWSHVETSEL